MSIFVGLVDNGPKYKMIFDDLREEVTANWPKKIYF